MSIQDNGGSVFPTQQPSPYSHYGFISTGGLNLRDYFAAKAMQGLLVGRGTYGRSLAEAAYEMADAMLEARKGKP